MEPETLFKVELKYCERCGGLFLRRESNPQVYCVTCAPEMREMAVPRKKPPVSEKNVFASRDVACV